MAIRLTEIIDILEYEAPPSLQEEYDNSGLITGHGDMAIHAAIISLDCTEEVIDEAISKGCNLVIAHHPIIFRGLKKLNGKNYFERAVIKAIKNDIAIYAIHTNLDNVLDGVNHKIADRLELINRRILREKKGILFKLSVYTPQSHAQAVRDALFHAGAGKIGNYSSCSFNSLGTGTFQGEDRSSPFVGQKGLLHQEEETKIETIVPEYRIQNVLKAMRESHPYEEIAYDLYRLENGSSKIGSGLVGELAKPVEPLQFLHQLKELFHCGTIRYTLPHCAEIRKIAVCGGSGSFLIPDAIASKSDIFITADLTYHTFFDAENRIILADIGHFESEQFTNEWIHDVLRAKLPTFATHFTGVRTNPVNYL